MGEVKTVSRRFRVPFGDPTEPLHGRIPLHLARLLRASRAPDEIRDQRDDGTVRPAPIGWCNTRFLPRLHAIVIRNNVAARRAVDLLLT